MMKLSTSNPTRKGEESGYKTNSEKEMEYDSDSDKEMKRNSDSDKKMEHNSDSDKKMEHDSNSDKEMEHNPNSDAIFKTKGATPDRTQRHNNYREGIQTVLFSSTHPEEELGDIWTAQHGINLSTLYPRQDGLSKKNTPGGSTRRNDHDRDPTRLCGTLAGFFHLRRSSIQQIH